MTGSRKVACDIPAGSRGYRYAVKRGRITSKYRSSFRTWIVNPYNGNTTARKFNYQCNSSAGCTGNTPVDAAYAAVEPLYATVTYATADTSVYCCLCKKAVVICPSLYALFKRPSGDTVHATNTVGLESRSDSISAKPASPVRQPDIISEVRLQRHQGHVSS